MTGSRASHKPTDAVDTVGNGMGGTRGKTKLKVIGRELPDIDTDEQFAANWKISKEKEEGLLVEFNDLLSNAGLLQPEHDKYYIRRFLRARQHDLEKARHMYADHVKWRKEFDVAGIVKDFNFHERDLFLTLYPQGYHKTDKLGRPIYIQHLGAINMKRLNEITNEDRMLKFHIQEYERCMNYIMPACSKTVGRHIEQTFAIIDVTGVGMSHISGQVKGLLSKITSVDQGNYPEMMGKTFIINAPGMFKIVWGIVKRFLDARTLTKIELVGTNYQASLLKYIDKDNLPEYLGGTSKATLLDDVGPWQTQSIIDEIDADNRSALSGAKDVEADSTKGASPRRDSDARPSHAGEGASLREPSRNLSIQGSRRYSTAESPGASPSERQSFHEAGPRFTRTFSAASEEEGYYSPRSDSTFASFSERSQNIDDLAGRLQAEGLDKSKSQDGSAQASIAARVRRLEVAIPGLREKLAPDVDLRLEKGSFSRSTGHNILGRVEMLEDALELLLTAQEQRLEQDKAHETSLQTAQPEEDKQKQLCGCCSIM